MNAVICKNGTAILLLGAFAGSIVAQPIFVDFDELGLPTNAEVGEATAVSGDGSVVVGWVRIDGMKRGFRWTDSLGFQILDLPPFWSQSVAYGVSGNGSVAVGVVFSSGYAFACKWPVSGGCELLVSPPGYVGHAFSVNGDGTVVVGTASNGSHNIAIRWRANHADICAGGRATSVDFTGNKVLVDNPPAIWQSEAPPIIIPAGGYGSAINAAGDAVVGHGSHGRHGWSSWLWIGDILPISISPPPGLSSFVAYAVSDGAQLVVGECPDSSGSAYRAVAWSAASQSVQLDSLLTSLGAELEYWKLQSSTGITPGGNYLVGFGLRTRDTALRIEPWRARIHLLITQNPSPKESCLGSRVEFATYAVGTQPIMYIWERADELTPEGWAVVHDGPTAHGSVVNGATTSAVAIDNVRLQDSGLYRCRIQNQYGIQISSMAWLKVCAGDFDCSGFIDIDDYTVFIAAFESGYESADVDGSGFVDLDDFITFVHAFEAGC